MWYRIWAVAAAIGLLVVGGVRAEEAHPATEPTTTRTPPATMVEGRSMNDFQHSTLIPSEQNHLPRDPADLLRRAPGAAVNMNVPLTGISQYRGMSGSRVNALVDGLNVSPACPNWMDPPLSFIPTGNLSEVVVVRGISPVSAGSESIGGTIRAGTDQGEFGASEEFEPHGFIGLGGQTIDSGYDANALLWLSNDHHRFQFSGTYLRGDDFDAGHNEEVVPSEYQRWNAGLGYGYRDGLQKRSLSYSFDKTEDTGTPALPMDICTVDAHTFRAKFENGFGAAVTDRWRIDGTLSCVRGRRRDINDDLYRIAPLNGILAVTYLGHNWSITAEGEFVAKQNEVSEVNAEEKTGGHALLNMYAQYSFKKSVKIRAGVRDVFDSFYQSHVAGINRVTADKDGNPTDLDVGERLPGRGRSFFLRAEYRF